MVPRIIRKAPVNVLERPPATLNCFVSHMKREMHHRSHVTNRRSISAPESQGDMAIGMGVEVSRTSVVQCSTSVLLATDFAIGDWLGIVYPMVHGFGNKSARSCGPTTPLWNSTTELTPPLSDCGRHW